MSTLKGDKKLKQTGVTVDLQNIYNFRFYGPIYMGSTARKVNVIYDTGSDVNTFTLLFLVVGC